MTDAYFIEPLCADFGVCGGCLYQNITYEHELELKQKKALDALYGSGVRDFAFMGIEPSHQVTAYRNKMEFSFGDNVKGGELCLGMRKRRSFYEVVTSSNCNLADSDFICILQAVLSFFRECGEPFYHKKTHIGSLRHLAVRKGANTGEILVNLVTTDSLKAEPAKLADSLLRLNLNGSIKGILHTINNSVADIVKSDEMRVIYGRDYIFDSILGLTFKISPFSFFQTNTKSAERLFTTVREFIRNSGGEFVCDLFCGTGVITLIAASECRGAVGIELVPEAVAAARENAAINHIVNCRFIAGDVLSEIDVISKKPDLVILDPPREGVHPKALSKILALNAENMIYVSCNPKSLARDLKIMEDTGYKVQKVKLHCMFPRTDHVESVAALRRA